MNYTFHYNEIEASYLYSSLINQLDDLRKIEFNKIHIKFDLIWEILFAYYGIRIIPIIGAKISNPYFSEKHISLFTKIRSINTELYTLLKKKTILTRFFKEICIYKEDTHDYDLFNLLYSEDLTKEKWTELSNYFVINLRSVYKSDSELQADFKTLYSKLNF